MASSSLPPDLFDATTVASLLSTVAIVAAAYAASRAVLASATGGAVRFLFIWHLADALCHFALEGSFLYHCFFSYLGAADAAADAASGKALYPTPYNFLGHEDGRVYGPQAGGHNAFAQLWMVYARADRRWAGVDLVRRPLSTSLPSLAFPLLRPVRGWRVGPRAQTSALADGRHRASSASSC